MAVANSNKVAKPPKPHKDFPLFAHARGYWVKKIRGKLYYFGRWDDPEGSLQKYLDNKDRILAGQPILESDQSHYSVGDLCNDYLDEKRGLVESGENTQRHWNEEKTIASIIVKVLGRQTAITSLLPGDFEKLRRKFSKDYGLHRVAKSVQVTRTIFNWAYESFRIETPVRFGKRFKKPSARMFRLHKANNKKLAKADEIIALLNDASYQIKAMILLGINAGFNNGDCSQLTSNTIDFDSGWLDWHRPKTGIERRVCLWPESILAIENAIEHRGSAKKPEHANCVFLTKYRNPWTSEAIYHEFRKLAEDCEIDRKGLTFTTLRHTFQTIGKESGDYIATRAIMAHVDESISATYRERVSDKRLLKVTEYIRSWLFGSEVAE